MKTVKDYLDLGLAFVGDDMIHAVTGEPSCGSAILAKCLFECGEYPSGIKLVGSMCGMGEWTPSSFAWRNNEGVKPEYKGVIEVELNSGHKRTAYVSEITWIRGFYCSVAKWRPVVLQSDDAKKKPYHSFVTSINIDGPKFTIKEETPKTITVNIEGRDYLVPSRTPTSSPKEDKPMKPVYTAAMHAKGELPPVGADFNIEGWDGVPCTMTGIGRDNVLFIYKKNEYTIGIKDVSFKPVISAIIKTIEVNGFDVPAPMSEAPEDGAEYFIPSISNDDFVDDYHFRGDCYDKRWLSKGIVHSTKKSAIAHAKAMLGIDPNA